MPIAPEETIQSIMAYWNVLEERGEKFTHWAGRCRPLRGWDACRFFIGVMLDQMQPAKRTWAAAEEFVKKARGNHWSPKTIWQHIAQMTIWELRRYCQFDPDNEYTGAYAGYNARRFPGWLRNNARIIVDQYELVENIWESDDLPGNNVQKIHEIHKRFAEFNGIGDNLANMAVFSLVRDHGYAGGRNSRRCLRIKFDTHVNRVLTKAILSGNPELISARQYVDILNTTLDSPADFDFALYTIGQDYCQYDTCNECPIHEHCNTYKDKEIHYYDKPELPVAFINQSNTCFQKFRILSFQLYYSSNNANQIVLDADEENIKQHDAGISVEMQNRLECSLRIENDRFVFSVMVCEDMKEPIENITVHPYISISEIVFAGQNTQGNIFIRLEGEPI